MDIEFQNEEKKANKTVKTQKTGEVKQQGDIRDSLDISIESQEHVQKGAEAFGNVTAREIGGPSLSKEEQKEYIKDVQKRAKKEGWEKKLYGFFAEEQKEENDDYDDILYESHPVKWSTVKAAEKKFEETFEGVKLSKADREDMKKTVIASAKVEERRKNALPKRMVKELDEMKDSKIKDIDKRGILFLLRPVEVDENGEPATAKDANNREYNVRTVKNLMTNKLEDRKEFLIDSMKTLQKLTFTPNQLKDDEYIRKHRTQAIRYLSFAHYFLDLYNDHRDFYMNQTDPELKVFAYLLVKGTTYMEYVFHRISDVLFSKGLGKASLGRSTTHFYTIPCQKGYDYKKIVAENKKLAKMPDDIAADLVDGYRTAMKQKQPLDDPEVVSDVEARKNKIYRYENLSEALLAQEKGNTDVTAKGTVKRDLAIDYIQEYLEKKKDPVYILKMMKLMDQYADAEKKRYEEDDDPFAKKLEDAYKKTYGGFKNMEKRDKSMATNLPSLKRALQKISVLGGIDENSAGEILVSMLNKDPRVSSGERAKRVTSFEQIFKVIADFDISGLTLDKFDELLSGKNEEMAEMTDAMLNLHPEVMDEYERMIKSSKYKCHLSAKAFQKIREKWEFLRNGYAVFNGFSEQKAVAERHGIDIHKLINRPFKDLYNLYRDDCDDREVSKLYSYCMEVVYFQEMMKKAG